MCGWNLKLFSVCSFRHEPLEKSLPVAVPDGDFVRTDEYIVIVEGVDIAGIYDI